jgi:hypothetical protein
MSEVECIGHEPQFAAFVGIDWADQKHVWCLQAVDSEKRESGELEHTPEASRTHRQETVSPARGVVPVPTAQRVGSWCWATVLRRWSTSSRTSFCTCINNTGTQYTPASPWAGSRTLMENIVRFVLRHTRFTNYVRCAVKFISALPPRAGPLRSWESWQPLRWRPHNQEALRSTSVRLANVYQRPLPNYFVPTSLASWRSQI